MDGESRSFDTFISCRHESSTPTADRQGHLPIGLTIVSLDLWAGAWADDRRKLAQFQQSLYAWGQIICPSTHPMLQYQIIPVTPFQQNCTLLWDDQTLEAVFIDAGGEVERLNQALRAKKLTLKALWLTHGHLDHAGGVGQLAREHGVPVIGPHQADLFWLEGLEMQSSRFGFAVPEPVVVHQWLEQGDTLALGSHQFEVRHAPGHTPGSVLIYSAEMGLLWTGDVLFVGSIGRTDFPQGDLEQLLASIRREVFTLPDQTRFISGHGPMGTLGHEKMTNPFVSGRFG